MLLQKKKHFWRTRIVVKTSGAHHWCICQIFACIIICHWYKLASPILAYLWLRSQRDAGHVDHKNRNKVHDVWKRVEEKMSIQCAIKVLKKMSNSNFRILLRKVKRLSKMAQAQIFSSVFRVYFFTIKVPSLSIHPSWISYGMFIFIMIFMMVEKLLLPLSS